MSPIRSRVIWILFLTVAFSLLFVPAADAYIDPGTGSFIFQAVIGMLVAVGLGFKIFWRRIVGMFSRAGGGSGGASDGEKVTESAVAEER